MDEEIQQAVSNLQTFKSALAELNSTLAPVLSEVQADLSKRDDDGTTPDAATALARARRHITLGYTAVSLFAMYLRLHGQSIGDHPVKDDLVRVQDAFMRLRKVEDGQSTAHQPRATTRRAITAKQAAALELSNRVLPEESALVRALWGGFDRRDGETEPEARARDKKRRKMEEKRLNRKAKREEKRKRHTAQQQQLQEGAGVGSSADVDDEDGDEVSPKGNEQGGATNGDAANKHSSQHAAASSGANEAEDHATMEMNGNAKKKRKK